MLVSNFVLVFTGVNIAKERGATLRSGPELEVRFGLSLYQMVVNFTLKGLRRGNEEIIRWVRVSVSPSTLPPPPPPQ